MNVMSLVSHSATVLTVDQVRHGMHTLAHRSECLIPEICGQSNPKPNKTDNSQRSAAVKNSGSFTDIISFHAVDRGGEVTLRCGKARIDNCFSHWRL